MVSSLLDRLRYYVHIHLTIIPTISPIVSSTNAHTKA